MVRRFIVIGFILAVAFLLLVIQNKVLTGSQQLTAQIQTQDEDTVVVVFRDVSGHVIPMDQDRGVDVDDFKEQVRSRLAAREGASAREAIALEGDGIAVNPAKNLQFTLEDAEQLPDLRKAIQGTPFQRENPPRDLFHVNLGIDLRGGVEFICRLYDNNNEAQKATDTEVQILRRRLDARGLTEPQVFRLSNGDVQVVIPGGTEADAAATRKVLETAGVLEFREVKGEYARYDLNRGVIKRNDNGTYTFGPEFGTRDWNDVIYPKKPQYPGDEPSQFLHLGATKVSGEHVESADPTMDKGRPALSITFTGEGGALNYTFTSDVYNRGPEGGGGGTGRIAICFDGVVESDPTIITPSGKGSLITGNFTQEEVTNLRDVLTAGALTRTPRVLSQQVVGASLGVQTITKGTWSMLAAFVLILAGMLGFYFWRLGTVALVSLFTCIGLIFVVLSIFGATLTLPGLAGLVLTVGMAVDANILIFERLREEEREDADLASCIDKAYSRAFITILDANLTTFITAFVLYQVGSGPVQGFGLTLMIGIATSMFSAIYVGRTLTDFLFHKRQRASVRHLGEIRLPYTRLRYAAFALSALLAVVGMSYFLFGKDFDANFDIDFTGGNQVQVTFTEPKQTEAIKDALRGFYREDPEAHAPLDPRRMQALPYYREFGGGAGKGSRQWMFKGPDDEGAQLEAQRAELEEERAAKQRKADQLREDKPEESATIQRQIEPLDQRIAELTTKIDHRQDQIKTMFRQAFPGLIPESGHEIVTVSWDKATLELVLRVIDTPVLSALAQVENQLGQRDEIESVTVEPAEVAGGHAVRFLATFTSPPTGIDELERTDAVGRTLAAALAGNDASVRIRHDQVRIAADFYDTASEELATYGISIDRPFPSTQSFSPQVAGRMKLLALAAILISIVCILAYVAARFEFVYGLGAITALVHDVVITIGLLSLFGVRIDLTVVAALLTIVGYSLNDTIVVFDRIRENIKRLGKPLMETIDISIAQTMSRTVLTSATTLVVVVILFFFGGDGLHAFSATLLVGILLGTYSSVFVASPVLVVLSGGRSVKQLVAESEHIDDEDATAEDETD